MQLLGFCSFVESCILYLLVKLSKLVLIQEAGFYSFFLSGVLMSAIGFCNGVKNDARLARCPGEPPLLSCKVNVGSKAVSMYDKT